MKALETAILIRWWSDDYKIKSEIRFSCDKNVEQIYCKGAERAHTHTQSFVSAPNCFPISETEKFYYFKYISAKSLGFKISSVTNFYLLSAECSKGFVYFKHGSQTWNLKKLT